MLEKIDFSILVEIEPNKAKLTVLSYLAPAETEVEPSKNIAK
jgi:hypothetical protein